jgi:hypothetical protein
LCTSVVPALGRLKEEDHEIEAYLGYRTSFKPTWATQRDPVSKTKIAGHWWLMPVILATQEAEIRRIVD